jgi:hypothetical protein
MYSLDNAMDLTIAKAGDEFFSRAYIFSRAYDIAAFIKGNRVTALQRRLGTESAQ